MSTGASGGRIASLDQFRGYTVAGMLLVNFLGGYAVVRAHAPILAHHNTYCSYADTIMPQFFFAVGFAYRLTWRKRVARDGVGGAWRHALTRCLGLVLFGLVLHQLDGGVKTWSQLGELGVRGAFVAAFRRSPFQTLVHIGLTSIWVLPVIGLGPFARAGFALASAGLHLALSAWFYFDHAWTTPVIDGGPLGFLSWSIPLLAGTLAYDVVSARGVQRALAPLLLASLLLMAAGYGLSQVDTSGACSPPFMRPEPGRPVTMWTMSQRTGSVSYMTFSAGFSLLVFAGFLAACDLRGLGIGLFRTFGTNALAAYVLHGMVAEFAKPYVPGDAPAWYVAIGFVAYFGLSYLFVRALEKQGVFIKL